MKLRIKILSFLSVLLLILTACDQTKPPEALGKIKIAVTSNEVSALVHLAHQKGFFQKAGLEVEIITYSSGKVASDALTAGKVDLATCSDFVFVKKASKETDLKILANIAAADSKIWIAASSTSGVRTFRDLKGKRIAVTQGSVGEYFLGQALHRGGLRVEDVTLIDLKPPQIIEGFAQGNLQIAITWEPNVLQLKSPNSDKLTRLNAQDDESFYFLLVSKQPWIQQHPQHAQGLLQGLAEADQWAQENQKKFDDFLIHQFNLSQTYVEQLKGWQKMQLNFPQALLITLDGQKRWLQSQGYYENNLQPNFLDFIDPSFLHAVSPLSVSVIK